MKVNKKLCADSSYEKARLRKMFPNEEDIVRCKRGDKACYVKGRLQPSRSFGDLTLKYAEFNNPHKKSRSSGHRTHISDFTGPYISCQPVIKVFELDNKFEGFLLATDGLWDELSKQEVLEIIARNKNNPLKPLLNEALKKAAKNSNISYDIMMKISKGKGARRKYHDDISMVWVDLK